MMALEYRFPNRLSSEKLNSLKRRLSNIGLACLNTVVLRMLPAISAAAASLVAAEHDLGLLYLVDTPVYLSIALSVILMDGAIFLQHWVFHRVPAFWRIHKVHHSDPNLDCTTALRFHPIEIVFSMIYKSMLVILLGAPTSAVIVFELILSSSALFNHGNVKLPDSVDKVLRNLIVTPNMHTVHHSPNPQETDSNYGFFLSIWDRLSNTYRDNEQPASQAEIGLKEYQHKDISSLRSLLKIPFTRQP